MKISIPLAGVSSGSCPRMSDDILRSETSKSRDMSAPNENVLLFWMKRVVSKPAKVKLPNLHSSTSGKPMFECHNACNISFTYAGGSLYQAPEVYPHEVELTKPPSRSEPSTLGCGLVNEVKFVGHGLRPSLPTHQVLIANPATT